MITFILTKRCKSLLVISLFPFTFTIDGLCLGNKDRSFWMLSIKVPRRRHAYLIIREHFKVARAQKIGLKSTDLKI